MGGMKDRPGSTVEMEKGNASVEAEERLGMIPLRTMEPLSNASVGFELVPWTRPFLGLLHMMLSAPLLHRVQYRRQPPRSTPSLVVIHLSLLR